MSINKEYLKSVFKNSVNKKLANANKAADARIIVDKSYCLYLSMFNAHNYIKKEYALEDDCTFDITTIADFREAFKKKFASTIYYTAKNALGGEPRLANVIFADDCPKKDIWRNDIFESYKLQRRLADHSKDPFNFAKAFKFANEEIIPSFLEENEGSKIIGVDRAEGDDVVASLARLLPEEKTKLIIANDKDYVQLLDIPNIILVNCQGKITDLASESEHKLLTESQHVLTAKEFLLKKILIGDKADNIESVFPRCGEVTALKLILNKDELKKKLEDPLIKAKFNLNKSLIDFKNIPQYILDAVEEQLNK